MKILSLLSRWRTRVLMIALHILFVGPLFLLDHSLLQQTHRHPWYTALYLFLVLLTIFQYLYTAGSNPGYVADALRDELAADTSLRRTRDLSLGLAKTERSRGVASYSSSTRLTLWLGTGSSLSNRTCPTCRVYQPPRSKHCHDCNKCVLRFDHYCAWLGTCVGYGNHCRFWWYIFEETILCLWTSVMYAMSLSSTGRPSSWLYFSAVIILLVLLLAALLFLVLLLLFHSYLVVTNQTTHELIRRKRIPEFRNIPENVKPYSIVLPSVGSEDFLVEAERPHGVQTLLGKADGRTCSIHEEMYMKAFAMGAP
ncbi:hypothetical protein GOP47_0025488 [Adiantum capillus-veneris]|uniref:S-acyltransferase n=1 Tax=Adiantum capillus-veneris TaxID=13818 RepID=A0A9D4Z312_ADICA|nr:hypothetical protein GOP47_0025488 [Adiantum capillus-veneris]